MQTYALNVKDRRIALLSEDSTLVRTSKGIDCIRIESEDAEWLDYDLSVALSIGGSIVEIEIAPTETNTGWHTELNIPDSVLEHDGPLGVTLHGTDSDEHHIITAKAAPLVIEHEGDIEN